MTNVANAIDVDAVRAISDPVERYQAANQALAVVAALSVDLAEIKSEVARGMREQGMSLAQIAAALGVTRSRSQQLLK